jgi:hypothetical protein
MGISLNNVGTNPNNYRSKNMESSATIHTLDWAGTKHGWHPDNYQGFWSELRRTVRVLVPEWTSNEDWSKLSLFVNSQHAHQRCNDLSDSVGLLVPGQASQVWRIPGRFSWDGLRQTFHVVVSFSFGPRSLRHIHDPQNGHGALR